MQPPKAAKSFVLLTGTQVARQDGNAASGRDAFRSETFGNEGFWTKPYACPLE